MLTGAGWLARSTLLNYCTWSEKEKGNPVCIGSGHNHEWLAFFLDRDIFLL
jgi:hypothetical protein